MLFLKITRIGLECSHKNYIQVEILYIHIYLYIQTYILSLETIKCRHSKHHVVCYQYIQGFVVDAFRIFEESPC